ncbi:glutamine--tRNA ligase/YqeY domain fusion protein [Pseudodesulfovibrio indicus]|uniref:Glutamine--tRNA ligase n=1 Tax=Pseudodesulfovibrio indicus TaxID=1716143 RepID=A0A126QLK7_9BACT|nr:glutamine--tRNA ligase/YqeY domain fusion protein [Pseudodesulfovibrio indicus]AMK10727.1 glutamine--tRNA ligase [Pseudodesulfovibrio indicus]TDT91712.1 glutaminyl-tRNA synthetase [Pseudodesulfovibrio indicus]
MSTKPEAPEKGKDFIRQIIDKDLEKGAYGGRVHTRFPPEPNGYLHIGHAKSICLNFGLARDYDGKCNLRFDDTNPVKEDVEYVDSIREDVRWLGFDWDNNFYASDYFERLYFIAELFIKMGKAYVDHQTADEIRENRGTLKEPGVNSPYRERSVDENLALFRSMRAGELPDGACILRAKIDMAAPNVMMRDPALYRIKHATHHRTGDAWCIYPMYDFTHGLSDAIEGITHSICTLEFENNRPLYDWCVDTLMDGLKRTELFGENAAIYTELAALPGFTDRPRQYEFARLNITGTVLSKRKLIQLVKENHVNGWDDPRMPTISGFRRRGFTPESLRDFCDRIGVAKADSMVEYPLLEACLREDLNKRAPRYMGIMDPVKMVIENYPEDQVDEFEIALNPEDESYGTRTVPFSREVWIERDDFMIDPPKKFFRLGPDREVRLRGAYYVLCTGYETDADGNVTLIRATFDPASRGGWLEGGRKVKGTLHWVSARHALSAEVRNYGPLFTTENPNAVEEGKTFVDYVDPNSLEILADCKVEPAMADLPAGTNLQFERTGYYCADLRDHKPGQALVFNRTTTLRDTWAKIQKQTA